MEKIVSVRVEPVSIPLAQPLGNHPFLGQRTKFVTPIVRIRSSGGAEGFGYVTAESTRQMQAVCRIVEDLAPHIAGRNALRRAEIGDLIWGLTGELLHEGAANLAIAAIDIALWDLFGRITGRSLADLLGGRHGRVRLYASHGLWRHCSLDDIAEDGPRLQAEGFTAMKLRLLGRNLAEDVARVRTLRQAVGPDVTILTDALWSLTGTDAVRLSRALAEYDVAWLEDPVGEDDLAGLARVRGAEAVPVAAGERLSRLPQVQAMLAAGAVDHLILDVHHLGGISTWLQAARLAEPHDIPVSAHIAYELQAPLVAFCKRPGWLEYFPFWDVLYRTPPRREGGWLAVSDQPGLGLELDDAAISRWKIA